MASIILNRQNWGQVMFPHSPLNNVDYTNSEPFNNNVSYDDILNICGINSQTVSQINEDAVNCQSMIDSDDCQSMMDSDDCQSMIDSDDCQSMMDSDSDSESDEIDYDDQLYENNDDIDDYMNAHDIWEDSQIYIIYRKIVSLITVKKNKIKNNIRFNINHPINVRASHINCKHVIEMLEIYLKKRSVTNAIIKIKHFSYCLKCVIYITKI